ncbi:tyrosine-type recombinase/integrase [Pseudoalteromonas sp. S3260]|uniref:tyrosine-type recombinase/integrase n=1 Tax=Pseudoalteromonas sp. S3260 TaxID=579534 RepID=UPI001486A8AE|nr:tyrosine-type recombinase/integrase [Pseudoalteromonas sp. S3260]
MLTALLANKKPPFGGFLCSNKYIIISNLSKYTPIVPNLVHIIMTTIAHTIKRNETYSFNYRLSDKIYRKSLKTDSPSSCRAYVSEIMCFIRKANYLGKPVSKEDIDQFIDKLLSNRLNDVVRVGKAITEPLSTTAKSYFNQWYKETDSQRNHQYDYDNLPISVPEPRPEYLTYSQWLSEKITYKFDYLRLALSAPDPATGKYELDTEHDYMYYFEYPSVESERYSYLGSIIDNYANKISIANDNNNITLANSELNSLKEHFQDFLPAEVNTRLVTENQQQPIPVKKIYLTDIEEDFWNYLRKTRQDIKNFNKFKANLNPAFQMLTTAFNGQSLDTVTHEDIEDIWNIICKLPTRGKLRPERYGFDENDEFPDNATKKAKKQEALWNFLRDADQSQLNEFAVPELLTTSTLSDWRSTLKYIFQYLKYKNHIHTNPLSEYELALAIPKNRLCARAKMPADIARLIIDYCSGNLSQRYSWAVLIMAYHGMRNEEVTSLHYDDIITDPETGIECFYIRSGKTVNAQRRVPIHTKLISLGFMDFVKDKVDEALFNFESNKLTEHFNFFRAEFNIPTYDLWNRKIVMYSFRHSVINMMNDELNNEHVYHLVGHSRNNTATRNYTDPDIQLYQEKINRIDYHN